MTLFDLTGRTAIVTGSSRGIGRAIAVALAASGAKVVVSSRKEAACETVVAEIVQAGGTAIAIPCNVSHKDQLQALVQRTRERLGPIDILVCNAAVNPYYGPLAEIPDEAYDRTMHQRRSNLWLASMVRPTWPRARGLDRHHLSIAAVKGTATLGAYASPRPPTFSSRATSRSSSARTTSASTASPPASSGPTSPVPSGRTPTSCSAPCRDAPGRLGEPEDMAGLAVFLASPASAFITGQAIIADGGVTLTGAV